MDEVIGPQQRQGCYTCGAQGHFSRDCPITVKDREEKKAERVRVVKGKKKGKAQYEKDPALHLAVRQQDGDGVAKIVEGGGNVNEKDTMWRSALHIAAWAGFPGMVETLASLGCVPWRARGSSHHGSFGSDTPLACIALASHAIALWYGNVCVCVCIGVSVSVCVWLGVIAVEQSRRPSNDEGPVEADAFCCAE